MPYLIAGFFLLWLMLTALRSFTRVAPAAAARAVRAVGGTALLLIAALMLFRGRFDFAIGLGGVGLWLLGWRQSILSGFGRSGVRKPPNATSRVRSAMIEMELDHDSGAMRGTALAGVFQDRALDSLTRQDCMALYAECVRDDPEGARLLEAYLDRRFSGWRATGEANNDARRQGPGSGGAAQGPMSESEAYEVLGLRKGASREEITR
ncbi:MAG: molecular chaperone DnaJ, partial [Methylobacteriaceae bacterium]|nr:molecular chaperone DnaJ [Methylobacteriaceae bacterium]